MSHLQNEDLYNLYSLYNVISVAGPKRVWWKGRAFRTGKVRNSYKIWPVNLTERENLVELERNGKL